MSRQTSPSIVAIERFIQATRDSGYKSTPSALAELVDNSLQASACAIAITITPCDAPGSTFNVDILDDGEGMDATALAEALRFGGSARFNDRRGLGRYGMGLPNSSLSQARRVEVYTWREDDDSPLMSYLDVDEVAAGALTHIPTPARVGWPEVIAAADARASSGTLIRWTRCDRLDNRRLSTLERKLHDALGQTFRYFITEGVALTINGHQVRPVDPMFLMEEASLSGAEVFGAPLEFEVRAPDSDEVGLVTVTFAVLPVFAWHTMSNQEKRARGIVKGAGVAIVRGMREVDYGWFFMGSKRRENYDDWWRCEVRFDPVLDEAFGITHTKQQIRPTEYVRELLTPEMELIGRALNSRVRDAHAHIKARARFAASERRAASLEARLPPPIASSGEADVALLARLGEAHPDLADGALELSRITYRLVEDEHAQSAPEAIFSSVWHDRRLLLALNPQHPFYKQLYGPLADADAEESQALRSKLELILMASARAELSMSDEERATIQRHRALWGQLLATFFNG